MMGNANTPTQASQRSGWHWALGIGLPVLGALSLVVWGFAIAAWGPLAGIVPALTCLVAAWLLRSWVGLAVVSVVYVGAGALMWILTGGGDINANFMWAIVLPGVVMAVIGTTIGMSRAR